MGTFLIVLVIVGMLIVLATRFSFYLYKSGALKSTHTRHLRRLHPATVGPASKAVSTGDASYAQYVERYHTTSGRARIGMSLLILLLVIGLFLFVLISVIGGAFS